MDVPTKSLVEILEFKPGETIRLYDAPNKKDDLLRPAGQQLQHLHNPQPKHHGAHGFVTTMGALSTFLDGAIRSVKDKGRIWVSWPKQASGVASALGENEIRLLALAIGLVDTKVCSVDNTWSGLKLHRRRSATL